MNHAAARGPHGVTVTTRADCSVVAPTGDMDLDHVEAFGVALLEACTAPGAPERVVVDLARLDFCDSAGLNTLLRARLLCEANARTLALANPRPQLCGLLTLTGTDLLFDVIPASPRRNPATPAPEGGGA